MAFSSSVVVVQQRRRPQELQRPQAGVAEQVDQGDVPEPQADLGDDQPDLRQRGERQGRLDVRLHAAGQVGVQRRSPARGRRPRPPATATRVQDRADPQQQERPEVDRQGAVEHGARRRRPFHRPRQPAGERHQRRLPGRRDQQQQRRRPVPAPRSPPRCPSGHGLGPEQLVEVPAPGQVVHHDRGQQQRRVGDAVDDPHPQPVPRPGPAAPGRTRPAARDDSPTSSQPANSVSIVPASEVSTMPDEEQGVQDEEPVVARLAVQVPAGERPDRPAQHERQDHERHRQPVEDELDREVVVAATDDPVAQLDRPRAACPPASISDEDGHGRRAARRRWPPGTARPVVALATAGGPSSDGTPEDGQQRRPGRRRPSRPSSDGQRSVDVGHGSLPCAVPRRARRSPANSRWSRQPRYQSTDDAARGRRVGLRLGTAWNAPSRYTWIAGESGSSTASCTHPLRTSRPIAGLRSMIREHRPPASSR